MLESDAMFISLPSRLRRHFNVSKQRKEKRPPLQRPGVLAIVLYYIKTK